MRAISTLLFGWLLLCHPAMAHNLASLLPKSAGDLSRVELVTGEAAQEAVDKLHGKHLPAQESAMARYARPGQSAHPAEVWVSRVESEQEARRQTGQMVHLMFENPKSPFKHPKRVDHNGIPVYRFEGMGMVHLIWYKGDHVWWVSAAPAAEQALLETLCR
ncbi:hypothetical protein GM415_05610 [Pseudodesulfovibrio cashew]|uniref:Uncharacterized protein n=1 Tax=Pseudodesulfovibrio cashew TaxID=2678688 RepID=A0A6I6J9W8_9BACT|nr:hypothetical protein [Pseudodesulfovibrio cashew]QGY39616.1 hypothetical protein GM415_05610 [Pseudodesulfovibrio cashew]